jgi:hypothetical protein
MLSMDIWNRSISLPRLLYKREDSIGRTMSFVRYWLLLPGQIRLLYGGTTSFRWYRLLFGFGRNTTKELRYFYYDYSLRRRPVFWGTTSFRWYWILLLWTLIDRYSDGTASFQWYRSVFVIGRSVVTILRTCLQGAI